MTSRHERSKEAVALARWKAPTRVEQRAETKHASARAAGSPLLAGDPICRDLGARSAAAQVLYLQRAIGNRAVVKLLGDDDKRSVQRKVSIRSGSGWRVKGTRTRRGPEVQAMLEEPTRQYYFNNKDEMSRWARRDPKTDNMGYIEKAKAWVRVPERSFTVIGETHTDITMMDLAEGLRTNRFRYEAFTENVSETSNPDLHEKLKGRSKDFEGRAPSMPAGRSHEGESLHPKILRGLAGVEQDVRGNAKDFKRSEHKAEFPPLEWAILDAKKAHLDVYNKYAVQLGAIIQAGKWAQEDFAADGFLEFIAGYRGYAETKIQTDQTAFKQGLTEPEDRRLFGSFDKLWTPLKRDYGKPDSPIMMAEKSRDFSMLAHIKDSKNRGDLFFGLGFMHADRLSDLLKEAKVDSIRLKDLIADQQKMFPQNVQQKKAPEKDDDED
jgi:hypothetical protein